MPTPTPPPVSMSKAAMSHHEQNYIMVIGQNIEFAQVMCDAYHREAYTKGPIKHLLKGLVQRLQVGKEQLSKLITASSRKVMEENVLDEETVSALLSIQTMLMNVPKGTLHECETYIRSRFNLFQNS